MVCIKTISVHLNRSVKHVLPEAAFAILQKHHVREPLDVLSLIFVENGVYDLVR